MSVNGSISRRRPHSFAGTAITDVNGHAVFAFNPVFPALPVCEATSESGSAGGCRIIALSTASCTVLLSTGAVSTPIVGAIVHLFATEPGRLTP